MQVLNLWQSLRHLRLHLEEKEVGFKIICVTFSKENPRLFLKTKSSSTWLSWAGIKGILNHRLQQRADLGRAVSVCCDPGSKHFSLFLSSSCTGRVRNSCHEICPASVVTSEDYSELAGSHFSERFESFLEVFNSHTFASHQSKLCLAVPSLTGLDAEGRFMLENKKDVVDVIPNDSSKCMCDMEKWELFHYDSLCLC